MIERYFSATLRRGDRVYQAHGTSQQKAIEALHIGIVAKCGFDSADIRDRLALATLREHRMGDCHEWDTSEGATPPWVAIHKEVAQ